MFEAVLAGPAGPAGQSVGLFIGPNLVADISVLAGNTVGEAYVPADLLLPYGNFIQFDAMAGGVTISATVTIV